MRDIIQIRMTHLPTYTSTGIASNFYEDRIVTVAPIMIYI